MAEPALVQTKTSIGADGPRLKTPRLEIIATTLPLVELEVSSPATLASALDADLESWPPPLNDEGSLRWTSEKLRANPERVGFFSWYVVLTNEQRRKLIGLVAFKGPPDNDGMIETGYSILENYQKQGIGTEATCAIIQWAFHNPGVRRIDAETFPELKPSIRVMERCGMRCLGQGSEPGTIRYGVTREEFANLLDTTT